MPIGLFDPGRPGPDNRMEPFFYGFAALGIPALRRCRESGSGFVSIDEVGYLEQQCPEYRRELESLLEAKQVIAAVRKQPLPFLQRLLARTPSWWIWTTPLAFWAASSWPPGWAGASAATS